MIDPRGSVQEFRGEPGFFDESLVEGLLEPSPPDEPDEPEEPEDSDELEEPESPAELLDAEPPDDDSPPLPALARRLLE